MDILLSLVHSGYQLFVPVIVLLSLLIFIHELGHFAVARYFGVRVETFSLGFGKKIFQIKKGDTNYCLSLIPLGGYVKMFGDDPGAVVSQENQSVSFLHKPVFQRILIVLGGPLMNLFFAIFLFSLIANYGEDFRSPILGDIAEDSVAFRSGFRSGDRISKINDTPVVTFDEVQSALNGSQGSLKVSVVRENSDLKDDLIVTPQLLPNPSVLSLEAEVGQIQGLETTSKGSFVGVVFGSPAYKAGLRTGDQITQINSTDVTYFRELNNRLLPFQNEEIGVSVKRFSVPFDFNSPTEDLSFSLKVKSFASIESLGLLKTDLFLADVVKKSPAERAGLQPGDQIISINELQTTEWDQVLNSIKSFAGSGAVKVTVKRNDEVKVFSLIPEMTSNMNAQGGEERRYTIGIRPLILAAAPLTTTIKHQGILSATTRGVERSFELTKMTLISFIRLIETKISPKNIGGVISIGQAASESYKMGYIQFFQMMAFISLHLFILNLLPVPVLDGGHLVFYTIEAIKGSPISLKKMEMAQQVGMLLLMSLMAFAFYNDFARLFGFS